VGQGVGGAGSSGWGSRGRYGSQREGLAWEGPRFHGGASTIVKAARSSRGYKGAEEG
jgi:hypothetical protein